MCVRVNAIHERVLTMYANYFFSDGATEQSPVYALFKQTLYELEEAESPGFDKLLGQTRSGVKWPTGLVLSLAEWRGVRPLVPWSKEAQQRLRALWEALPLNAGIIDYLRLQAQGTGRYGALHALVQHPEAGADFWRRLLENDPDDDLVQSIREVAEERGVTAIVEQCDEQCSHPVLVFTVSHNGGLVLAHRHRARYVARIYEAFDSKTWGELYDSLPPQEVYDILYNDSGDEVPGLTEPFDSGDMPAVCDGDYPPWLQQEMSDVVPPEVLDEFGDKSDTLTRAPLHRIIS